MSGLKEFGGCLWKLFQLGIVAVLLVLGFMFIATPQGEEPAVAGAEDEIGARKLRGGETGLVAKLKQVLIGGRNEGSDGDGSDAEAGVGSNLQQSQKEAGTGHVDLETLLADLEGDKAVKVQVAFLAEGTTQIQQTLYWQIHDGHIYYRILLKPYDRTAHAMMMRPGEALFMSFLAEDQARLVPDSSDHRIAMKNLRVATKEGHAVAWFYDGRLPLGGVPPEAIHRGRVGWIFSNELHVRLKQLQVPAAPAGDRETNPFGIEIPVDEKERPAGR